MDTVPEPPSATRRAPAADAAVGGPAVGGGAGPLGPRARPRLRLRATPLAVTHAPLLLGLDTAGTEHPLGPDDPDDESLVGRCWGCACGWRGSVRDVATRHFRPQVGDGGGLRRRRLARADRDARGELEAHLADVTATVPRPEPPPAPGTATRPAPPAAATAGDRTGEIGDGAHGRTRRRRRLTLPRTTSDADPSTPAGATSTAAAPSPSDPPAAPDDAPELRAAPTDPVAEPGTAPEVADPEATPSGGEALDPAEPPTAGPPTPPARGAGADALAAAATRVQRARAELHAAETELEAAVAAARAAGVSWRTIARATGVPHREAATRWSEQDSARPSL